MVKTKKKVRGNLWKKAGLLGSDGDENDGEEESTEQMLFWRRNE